MTAPARPGHPPWCVEHECTIRPDLPLDEGQHHSQMVLVPTMGVHSQRDVGALTAWLTQRVGLPGQLPPTVYLHLYSSALSTLACIPTDTLAYAMHKLGQLVGLAEPDPAGDAAFNGPQRPRPSQPRAVLQLTYPQDIADAQQAADRAEADRRLGGWPA